MSEDDARDPLTHAVIGCAMRVHSELGPGLLESAYEACLFHELMAPNIPAVRQVDVPVMYRGQSVQCGYRLDLVVQGKLIVEVKAVEGVLPVHRAQLLTYLRLARIRRGLLLNFNVMQLREGITRLVYDPPAAS